jgi:hypothetical protein
MYCCSPKGDGSVSIIDINRSKVFVTSLNDLKTNVTTIPLSSLIENLEIVQLEDKDEAFFNPWFTTVTENYIGVRQREGRPYLLFSRSGQFLGNIGSVGGGPGEYQGTLYDDFIDNKNGLIYLAPFVGNKILVYNTSGAFVKDILMPHRLNKPKLFMSDNILSVLHMSFSEDSPMGYQITIPSGINTTSDNTIELSVEIPRTQNAIQIVNELLPPAHFLVNNFDGEIFNTRNVQGVFDFVQTGIDTLYHFDVKSNRLIPYFTMASNAEGLWKNYFQINKDLIMTGVSEFDATLGYFVRRGLVATDLRNKTSSHVNIVNDFFGNLPVQASGIVFRNGYFVYNVQPEELMDEIEKRLSESNITESDRQRLNELLSKLREDTNNVVFIGKLKSEITGRLF